MCRRIRIKWHHFLENGFITLIVNFCLQKTQKFLILEWLEDIWRKKFPSIQKASLTKHWVAEKMPVVAGRFFWKSKQRSVTFVSGLQPSPISGKSMNELCSSVAVMDLCWSWMIDYVIESWYIGDCDNPILRLPYWRCYQAQWYTIGHWRHGWGNAIAESIGEQTK